MASYTTSRGTTRRGVGVGCSGDHGGRRQPPGDDSRGTGAVACGVDGSAAFGRGVAQQARDVGAGELQTGRGQTFARLNRSALPMTETDDSDMAPAAIMGESKMPKKG